MVKTCRISRNNQNTPAVELDSSVNRMKSYFLTPSDGNDWLSPEEVAKRLRTSFARVDASAEEARKQGDELIRKYKTLVQAGLGNANSTSVEELELRWSGALSVVASVDDDGAECFRAFACNGYRLELIFGPTVSGRKHRSLADKTANALGYLVNSVDGD